MDNEKPRILIVDDEVFNLQFLTELLGNDYRINAAKNGLKAFELTQRLQPDLIILDVVMPQMDGHKVIKKIKNDPDICHIPVIFLTSLGNAQDEEKGLSLGALDYINKPFHPAIVKARVNNILELVKHRKLVEKISFLDGLTNIPNRRAYDKQFISAWQRACHKGHPLSLGFLDIDYFKNYNDHYGHAAGDLALKRVAQTLEDTIARPTDFAARYGGEEFAFILPGLKQQQAYTLGLAVKNNIEALAIEHQESLVADILTVSIGGATIYPSNDNSLEEFALNVDNLLYTAKSKRNHVRWQTL